MSTFVNGAEVYQLVDLDSLPKGIYSGYWSGYEVKLIIAGTQYGLTTVDGVKGINIKCIVNIAHNSIAVRMAGERVEVARKWWKMRKHQFVILEQLIAEYLDTLPVDDGAEYYGSYRELAKEELTDFLERVKSRRSVDIKSIEITEKCQE